MALCFKFNKKSGISVSCLVISCSSGPCGILVVHSIGDVVSWSFILCSINSLIPSSLFELLYLSLQTEEGEIELRRQALLQKKKITAFALSKSGSKLGIGSVEGILLSILWS